MSEDPIAGRDGCDCIAPASAQACRFTTPRDPEARLIHYIGSNQDGEEDGSRARNVYGYPSLRPELRGEAGLDEYVVRYWHSWQGHIRLDGSRLVGLHPSGGRE